jgi:hypothetical protein
MPYMGVNGFTSPPKEVALQIFIALKNPSSQQGFNPRKDMRHSFEKKLPKIGVRGLFGTMLATQAPT